MVKKLTFLSTTVQNKWSSLYKTGIWTASLIFLGNLGIHWFPILLFIGVSLGIYFSLPPERINFASAYWVFSLSASLLVLLQTSASFPIFSASWISVFLYLISAIIFFFVLELTGYSFINQFLSFSVINTGVLIFLFLGILPLASPFSLSTAGIILFIGLFLLFQETFRLTGVSPKKSLVLGAVAGLLGIELAWVIISLPLGVLNSAALLALFFVIIREILINHFRGALTTAFVFRQFTFLVLFMIIIFAASRWSL